MYQLTIGEKKETKENMEGDIGRIGERKGKREM